MKVVVTTHIGLGRGRGAPCSLSLCFSHVGPASQNQYWHAESLQRPQLSPILTGLILRCAGKAGNPFQTTQGNRLSCRDQEVTCF